MRRRVARVLRWGLFALGLGALLAMPLTFLCRPEIISPWPMGVTAIWLERGALTLLSISNDENPPLVIRVESLSNYPPPVVLDLTDAIRPAVGVTSFSAPDDAVILVLPLWLLAIICLAWPVTSFILARRKLKRGFPVEPKLEEGTATSARRE